jgi:hypothetical protein
MFTTRITETPSFDYSARKYIALQILKEVLKHEKTYSIDDAVAQVGQYVNEIYFCPVPLVYLNEQDGKVIRRSANVIRDDILLFMGHPQRGAGVGAFRSDRIYELCMMFCKDPLESIRRSLVDEIRKELEEKEEKEEPTLLPGELIAEREKIKEAVESALKHGATKERVEEIKQSTIKLVNTVMDLIKTPSLGGHGLFWKKKPMPTYITEFPFNPDTVRTELYGLTSAEIVRALMTAMLRRSEKLTFGPGGKKINDVIYNIEKQVKPIPLLELLYAQIICRLVDNIVFSMHTGCYCECEAIMKDIATIKKACKDRGSRIGINAVATVLLVHLLYGKEYRKKASIKLRGILDRQEKCQTPFPSSCDVMEEIYKRASSEHDMDVLTNIFMYISCNMRGAKVILTEIVASDETTTFYKSIEESLRTCAWIVLDKNEQVDVFKNLVKLRKQPATPPEAYAQFSFGVLNLLHNYRPSTLVCEH